MMIELLTPLLLATAPVRIDVPEGVYNHATQARETQEGTNPQFTMNGTRTFSPTGRPMDADSD